MYLCGQNGTLCHAGSPIVEAWQPQGAEHANVPGCSAARGLAARCAGNRSSFGVNVTSIKTQGGWTIPGCAEVVPRLMANTGPFGALYAPENVDPGGAN